MTESEDKDETDSRHLRKGEGERKKDEAPENERSDAGRKRDAAAGRLRIQPKVKSTMHRLVS